MPRVLIPTDDPTIDGLVHGYETAGWHAVKGTGPFYECREAFDLVHFFWPEEFCHWRRWPARCTLDDVREIEVLLDQWSARCHFIMTVNNVRPHSVWNRSIDSALYQIFYDRVVGLHHYSDASRRLINDLIPSAGTRRSVVTAGFNFEHLYPVDDDRESRRREFGYEAGDFVILSFGGIRRWDEAQLIRHTVARIKDPRARFMLLGRFTESRRRLGGAVHQAMWRLWRRRVVSRGIAIALDGRVPDSELHRYLLAADAIIVPRIESLNSGLVFLGMTFGTLVVAPDHGSYPDQLSGTQNIIYRTGDPDDLAGALDHAATLDLSAIRQQNRAISRTWTWDRIAAACIGLLDGDQGKSPAP